MKIKAGPKPGDITLLDDDGNVLLGSTEKGSLNSLMITEISFNVRARETIPRVTLECEVFGYETELDVKVEEVTAILRRVGITKIEDPGKEG